MSTLKSVDERLAQEDQILRQIRSALSAFGAVSTSRRKGAVYASSPITTGWNLYQTALRLGFTDLQLLKRDRPEIFYRVFKKNLYEGEVLTKQIEMHGYPLVITPGQFFADKWEQEHYMSLWRQVIPLARTVCFNQGFQYSTGSAEEYLISIQLEKYLLTYEIRPIEMTEGARRIRQAVDEIASWGFDPLPLYNIWRRLDLTIDAIRKNKRKSISFAKA